MQKRDYDAIVVGSGPNGFAAYSQNINNLGIGSYCVTVTNGCVSTTKCVDLIACDQANITVNQMAIKHTCNCSCAFGEISVSASGGNSPYTYQWSTGSTSTTVKNLAAGQYSVTAKSYSGCYSKPTNFSINNSQPFEQKVNNKDCTDEYYCNGNLVPSLTKPAPRTEQYNASDCGYMDLVCSRTGAVIQYKYRPVEYAQTNVRNNNNCTIEDICRNGGRVIRYQGNKRDEEGIFYDQRGNSYCGKATICNLGDGDFISNFVEYGFQEYRTVIDCKDEHNTSGVIIDVYCAKNRIYSYCKPSVVFKGEDSPSFQKNEHLDITNLQLRRVEKPSFLSKNTLTLYPNPFSSDFNIDFYSDKDQNIRINIIDLMGRKVEQKQEKVLIGSNNITLSAPNLFKGLYWVEVIDAENHKLMGKITKM